MSTLTESLRVGCREFVQQHLPQEASFFDDVWDAFWQALHCKDIDELEAGLRFSDDTPVCVLGAMDGRRDLDTLAALGAMVSTVVALRNTADNETITRQNIIEELQRESVQLEMPHHLRPILLEYGSGLLGGLLGVEMSSESPPEVIDPIHFWVECCIPQGKSHEEPCGACGSFTEGEVKTQFLGKRRKFDLFVDEQSLGVDLPKMKTFVPWEDLQARHKKMLSIILESLRTRKIIRNKMVCEIILLEGADNRYSSLRDNRRVRTVLSELNGFLHHVFKGIVVAEKGMDQYAIHGALSYCWIRSSRHSTRLRPSVP
jgi:hypothetical protein